MDRHVARRSDNQVAPRGIRSLGHLHFSSSIDSAQVLSKPLTGALASPSHEKGMQQQYGGPNR